MTEPTCIECDQPIKGTRRVFCSKICSAKFHNRGSVNQIRVIKLQAQLAEVQQEIREDQERVERYG